MLIYFKAIFIFAEFSSSANKNISKVQPKKIMKIDKAKLEALLSIKSDKTPKDFERFWKQRYEKMLDLSPRPAIFDTGIHHGVRVFDLEYRSTNEVKIGGWMTLPKNGLPQRGFVVLHGYDGRDKPDFNLPFEDAAVFYPCCRGISQSSVVGIPSNPQEHVLHKIGSRDDYILGGCVEDAWLAISAMIEFFPELKSKIGILGISFGGGIAALASAWDSRISKAHFNVPSFGNHPVRLKIPTVGSALAVQDYHKKHGEKVLETLKYHDAATAARFIKIPTHSACAITDKVVAPEGQFSIYNNLAGPRELMVLKAGHCKYPGRLKQEKELLGELGKFFSF